MLNHLLTGTLYISKHKQEWRSLARVPTLVLNLSCFICLALLFLYLNMLFICRKSVPYDHVWQRRVKTNFEAKTVQSRLT